jgi:hypothetical protein
MNKLASLCLVCVLLTNLNISPYTGSTTASVVLSGGIISARHVDVDKKYKRKDCPVCKGKGWYMSGDNITKVPCGYCEPDKQAPASTQPQCSDDKCKTIIIRR